jgi:uncharacterized protein with von Willebrand factor type A (vWA) domain
VFDDAFERFFIIGAGPPQLESPPLPGAQTRESGGTAGRRRGPGHAGQQAQEVPGADTGQDRVASVGGIEDGEDSARGARVLRASYSPLEGEGPPPVLDPPDRAWRDAAAALVQRLHAGLSRRWRPAHRGERFDLRRTLRTSLHSGGEVVVPRWRARPHRRPRFVVLVDGSRSMAAHAQTPLRMAVALAGVTLDVEAFTFSTELRRVTRDVRRAAAGRPQALDSLHYAWGGGTAIGACLREFVRRFGERLLTRDTIVIIASDGLDVGPPDVLREAMGRIRRRSAGIVWLNPLVETRGYEPTAAGMSAARPFVTTFTWVDGAAGLVRLSRTIRLRS